MNRKLLDILACPIDKQHPLELIEFESNNDIVIEGVLLCSKCKRFYPIKVEIPIMLPDDLRNHKEDEEFLLKWKKGYLKR